MIAPRWLAIAAACTVALTQCSRADTSIVRIGTDRAELTAYVSYLNARQDDIRVELVYLEDPGEALERRTPPDLLIGSYLSCPSLLQQFEPLDDLFTDGPLDAAAFYSGLLDLGALEGRRYVLPISFNIPAVVFRQDGEAGGPGLVLSLEEMRRGSVEYNEMGDNGFVRIGYSPLWSDEFLLVTAGLRGVSFRANPDCGLLWDGRAVGDAVSHLRQWVRVDNQSVEYQAAFEATYMYDPPLNLLRDGRILYMLVYSDQLVGIPEPRLEGLDFRWLAHGDSIPVREDVLYAGIPATAQNKPGARAVLALLLSPALQNKLIERSFATQMDGKVFGIGGGFSSLREVTERGYPNHYQQLIGHTPPADFLAFPAPLPRNWPDIRESLVKPWLREQVSAEGQEGADLSELLSAHVRDGLDRMAREKE